jgi:hypothetical protein
MQTELKYPHRLNPDGTYDSICTRCFRTIANANEEADLAAAEEAHNCSLADLDRAMIKDVHRR